SLATPPALARLWVVIFSARWLRLNLGEARRGRRSHRGPCWEGPDATRSIATAQVHHTARRCYRLEQRIGNAHSRGKRRQVTETRAAVGRGRRHYASLAHFCMKLFLAAPASRLPFRSTALV